MRITFTCIILDARRFCQLYIIVSQFVCFFVCSSGNFPHLSVVIDVQQDTKRHTGHCICQEKDHDIFPLVLPTNKQKAVNKKKKQKNRTPTITFDYNTRGYFSFSEGHVKQNATHSIKAINNSGPQSGTQEK